MRDLISIEQVQPSYIFWQIRTIVPEKGEEGEEKEHGIHIILAPRQPLSCNESDNYQSLNLDSKGHTLYYVSVNELKFLSAICTGLKYDVGSQVKISLINRDQNLSLAGPIRTSG